MWIRTVWNSGMFRPRKIPETTRASTTVAWKPAENRNARRSGRGCRTPMPLPSSMPSTWGSGIRAIAQRRRVSGWTVIPRSVNPSACSRPKTGAAIAHTASWSMLRVTGVSSSVPRT